MKRCLYKITLACSLGLVSSPLIASQQEKFNDLAEKYDMEDQSQDLTLLLEARIQIKVEQFKKAKTLLLKALSLASRYSAPSILDELFFTALEDQQTIDKIKNAQKNIKTEKQKKTFLSTETIAFKKSLEHPLKKNPWITDKKQISKITQNYGRKFEKGLKQRLEKHLRKMSSTHTRLIREKIKKPVTLAEDYSLAENQKTYCKSPKVVENNKQWTKWQKQFGPVVSNLWKGLKAACTGKRKKAERYYKESFALGSKKASTLHFALLAKRKQLASIRSVGIRSGLLPLYLDITKIWENSKYDPKKSDYSGFETIKVQVNDYLWASRYAAIGEDFKLAEKLSLQALDILSGSKKLKLSKNGKEELDHYRLEAFYVLADRIEFEKGNYKKALNHLEKALKVRYIDKKWDERIHWKLGFYSYLIDDQTKAKRYWEKLVEKTEDKVRKAQILFWMISIEKQASKLRDELLAELIELSPTHYYSVMALKKVSSKFSALSKILHEDSLENLKESRSDHLVPHPRKDLAIRFSREMRRVSLLGKFGEKVLAGEIGRRLYFDAQKTFVMKKYPQVYVNLSRMFFGIGEYPYSISITTNLINEVESFWKRWPEQLFVYFPKPFSSDYASMGRKNDMDINTLFAITRQESAFNAGVKSHAGAYGLMQLIEPTAKSLAKQLKLPTKNLKGNLLTPKTNIFLGSRYLKNLYTRLKSQSHAVYAAYNAGANTVEKWLANRPKKDPFVWIESIPYGETRSYTRNVWRNKEFYSQLDAYFDDRDKAYEEESDHIGEQLLDTILTK